MRGYWHQKMDSSRSVLNKSGQFNFSTISKIDGQIREGAKTTNKSTKCEEDQLVECIQSNLNFMKKKQSKLNTIVQKMTKVQDFYQIISTSDFVNMGIRCFQHNSELIVYCVKDRQLLCSNCIYTQQKDKNTKEKSVKKNQKTAKANQKDNLSKSRLKTNQNKTDQQLHTKHQIKQVNKATNQIANDVKCWQVQLQDKLHSFSTCQVSWSSMKQDFQKMKKSLMSSLDKQFDNMQMQLSKKYSEIKKQLNEMSQKYQLYLQKILSHHRIIKKLMIPNRYPVPCVKHCWLQLTKKIMQEQIPLDPKQITNSSWFKVYEMHGKNIIQKFNKKKKQSI